MSYKCPTSVLQMSYKCPTNVLQMSYTYPAYKCPTNTLQIPYTCPTNTLQIPNKCPTNTLQMPYKCPTDVLQVSYKCHTSVLQMSNPRIPKSPIPNPQSPNPKPGPWPPTPRGATRETNNSLTAPIESGRNEKELKGKFNLIASDSRQVRFGDSDWGFEGWGWAHHVAKPIEALEGRRLITLAKKRPQIQ